MDFKTLQESCECWFVHMLFPTRSGYALWGKEKGSDRDIVLCVDRRLVLTNSILEIGHAKNLLDQAGTESFDKWRQLVNAIANYSNNDFDVDGYEFPTIDFPRTLEVLEKISSDRKKTEPLRSLASDDANIVINAANMIYDLGVQKDDAENLFSLADYLTEKELSYLPKNKTLEQFNVDSALDELRSILQQITFYNAVA